MSSLIKWDYDIIVAGGGLAGMIVATSAAHYSKQSLRILIIDRNNLSNLGKKTLSGWICGDAVGKNTVEYMSSRIGIEWKYPEIEHPVKGVIAYSPDHQTAISFDGEGYILNRKLLPQKQMNDAVKAGIEIRDRVTLRSLIVDNNNVIGVEGEDTSNRCLFKKTAKIVVDCTGVTSVLRNTLAIKSYIQRRIDRDDLEATGRYIYNFDVADEDDTFFNPDYCIIHLDQKLAPEGNGWGTWQVSVRRQNDCMVANGYMLVGDSAWMPKPLDAGGIGPAIIAATIVGKDAVEAIQAGDTSEKGLWKYNKHFIDEYGYKTAGLEVFRRMLQGLTNEQINYGMKHFLSKMDIDKITKGEHPEFSTVDKLGMIIRGAMNKKLAEDLRYCASTNKVLTDHYHNYPEAPEGFPEWHNVLIRHLENAFLRYKGDSNSATAQSSQKNQQQPFTTTTPSPN